jgi:SET domain-containing protein
MILPFLFIAPAGLKGRGVFTSEAIAAGTVVEIAPVIVMGEGDRKLLDQTLLHDYIFEWGPEQRQCCMALGYVPVYNHSYASNCEYEMDYDDATIIVKTVQPVNAGQELVINYNGDWNDSKPVWFEVQGFK